MLSGCQVGVFQKEALSPLISQWLGFQSAFLSVLGCAGTAVGARPTGLQKQIKKSELLPLLFQPGTVLTVKLDCSFCSNLFYGQFIVLNCASIVLE